MVSIARLVDTLGARALVGAGTVRTADEVGAVADAGGGLIVSPHFDGRVVDAARRRGLMALPGVATPSEAFAALDAGADGLKLFPAEMIAPPVVKAMRAVLLSDVWVAPVGGITPDNMAPYWQAGADGFGIGSALFKPGIAIDEIRARAARFVSAWKALSRKA
jgi:2-dehydro-3-deoxyphosphogalactonate aldolase